MKNVQVCAGRVHDYMAECKPAKISKHLEDRLHNVSCTLGPHGCITKGLHIQLLQVIARFFPTHLSSCTDPTCFRHVDQLDENS